MSRNRKAFLVWLTIMTLFVVIASTVGARFGPVDEATGCGATDRSDDGPCQGSAGRR
jgi:hypothetical protein